MTPITCLYLVYLAASAAFTVGVARTLRKNGRVFIIDCFQGREDIADSVNQLLTVGFYLVNFGFVFFALKSTDDIENTQQVIEVLSVKLGFVLLVLGVMHFGNCIVLSKIRRRRLDEAKETRGTVPPPLPGAALSQSF